MEGDIKGKKLWRKLNSISDKDWCIISYELNIRTRRYLKKFPILKPFLDPDDLVLDAIERIYVGVRAWDGKSLQSLKGAIWVTIRSRIDQFYKRERKRTEVYERFFSEHRFEFKGTNTVDYQLLYRDVKRSLSKDVVVSEVIDCLFEDPSLKPSEISALTGYTTDEIQKAKKRLRKRLECYKEEFKRDEFKEHLERRAIRKAVSGSTNSGKK